METIAIIERPAPAQCPADTDVLSTDEILVANCLEGAQAAWARFAAEYDAVIRHAVQWTLKHHNISTDNADDIIQDIYFRLIKSEYKLLETWDASRGTLKTWLAVVSRSAAIDFMRTDRTYLFDAIEEYENIQTEEAPLLDLPDIPLHALSTRQKSVLQCIYGQDMSAVEAAKQLDIHPQTVRSIHHTALQKLRATIYH